MPNSAIENPVATVGAEQLARRVASWLRVGAETAQSVRSRLPPERHDFNRDRYGRPKPLHQLSAVRDDNESLARCRYDLLAQQSAPCPLDQVERADFNFISAVDRQVQPSMFGEAGERNAALACLRRAAFGRGDRPDAQPCTHTADQSVDGEASRGTGAQPDQHAILHQGGGSLRCLALLRVAVHQPRTALNTRSQFPEQIFATSVSDMP